MEHISPRQKLLMDRDWKFHRGDGGCAPDPALDGSTTCYASKSESGRGAAAHSFYDGDWETVSLPHDYAVSGVPEESGNSAHGYLRRGPGWYRKTFLLEPGDEQKRLTLVFDGAATNCTVWVNGVLMARHFGGFNGFRVDFTETALFGGLPNVVAVRTDTDLYGTDSESFEGWWYDGAGLYRHVWLEKTAPLHIAPHGIWPCPRETENGFHLPAEVTLRNDSREPRNAEVWLKILSEDSGAVAEASQPCALEPGTEQTVSFAFDLENVLRWDLESPHRYRAEATVRENGNVADQLSAAFGFRSIRFDAEKGFFLNGRPVKIQGVSNHQDHGCLGTAVPDNLVEWRILRLKEMGCNGWRCAHNPPSEEFLEACDRLGMLVMSENRWFVPGEQNLAELREMIRRERRHPSIICWSVGNEEPLQCGERGLRTAQKLIDTVKRLDPSRPCTLACNGGFFERQAVGCTDVIGMNYFPWLYDEVHKRYPGKAIVSTEAAACNNCRGVYQEDPELNRFTAYDRHAPSFGSTHRDAWKAVAERDYVAGVFFWPGYEYRGETRWPSLFAEAGMLDSNGFRKDTFYLMQALWTKPPMIHLLPHWSLRNPPDEVEVCAYTNCETAELFLNGKSLGEQAIDPFRQGSWKVRYEPGTLEVIGRNGGKEAAREAQSTSGSPRRLRLTLETPEVRADGEQAALITVSVEDESGNPVPYADPETEVSITGDAEFLGMGASPIDHTPVTARKRRLYNGLMQVAVRAGETGKFTVTAASPGLESASLDVNLPTAPPRPWVKSVENLGLLTRWWMSVVFDQPRTPENFRHRMPAEPGAPFPLFQLQQGYGMMYLSASVPRVEAGRTLALRFEEITGPAEIWVRLRGCDPSEHLKEQDMLMEGIVRKAGEQQVPCPSRCKDPCELRLRKDSDGPEPAELPLPPERYPGGTPIHIWVGLKGESAGCGLTGLVKWKSL